MSDYKIIFSTSDSYHHLLRMNIYSFNKNWSKDQPVEIVGYREPDFELPANFTFVSLGEQKGGAENFGGDLREYFKKQPEFFIWAFDDSYWREVNFEALNYLWSIQNSSIGRTNLCSRATKLQEHFIAYKDSGHIILENTQRALYRLCTQPSIWNRQFLLKYLNPGLNVWRFETQKSFNDGYRIIGLEEEVVIHTELVTKHNIWKLDLHGIPREQIKEMETLGILTDQMEYER